MPRMAKYPSHNHHANVTEEDGENDTEGKWKMLIFPATHTKRPSSSATKNVH